MPEGNFSCADLVVVSNKMEQMWADSVVQKQYTPQANSALAVLTEQTAQFIDLKNSLKDVDVRIEWIDHCAGGVTDCTDECSITGTEAQATCEDYAISICKETEFVVKDLTFRTSSFSREEVTARGWMNSLKRLDEEIAKTVVAKIDSFAGVNPYVGGIGNVVGTDTFVSGAYWTAEIMSYLAQVSILNKSQDVYILDGDNLFQQTWMAQYNQANANGGSQIGMLSSIRKYFDLFNVNAVVGAKKTFLIDKGAVALISKVRYPSTPEQILNGANVIRWSVPSNYLPNIAYDVVYQTECSGSDIFHKYKFIARFDVFLNPTSACDTTNTGVLSFTCGEAP